MVRKVKINKIRVAGTSNGDVVTASANLAVWATPSGGPAISSVTVTDSSYTNLDDTAVSTSGGYIKILGSGFATGCQVIINATTATSTTFISDSQVRAQIQGQSAGTYSVYVVNPDGSTAIKVGGITFSSTPTWITASSRTLQSNVSYNVNLSATSDTTVTYSLQSGSTLPEGFNLNSTGLLTVLKTVASNTVYSFTVEATDLENQNSPRTFNITITTDIRGAQTFANTGTFTFSVPTGVTSVSVVCVGAGGGASGGTSGGNTSFTANNVVEVHAGGGSGSVTGGNVVVGTGRAGLPGASGGGRYGGGGGGAGGYTSDGAAAGGGAFDSTAGGGGGVGLFGGNIGGSGGGSVTSVQTGGAGGSGGSNGQNGGPGGGIGKGGLYGGGGGGYGYGDGDASGGGGGALAYKNNIAVSPGQQCTVVVGQGGTPRAGSFSTPLGGNGGNGAVRIIWGDGRAFPNSNTSADYDTFS